MLLSRSTEATCMLDWSAIFTAMLDLLLDWAVGAISKLAKMNEAATLRLSERGFDRRRDIFRMLFDMLLDCFEKWLMLRTVSRISRHAFFKLMDISQLSLSLVTLF